MKTMLKLNRRSQNSLSAEDREVNATICIYSEGPADALGKLRNRSVGMERRGVSDTVFRPRCRKNS
jgi:hypothetical protein